MKEGLSSISSYSLGAIKPHETIQKRWEKQNKEKLKRESKSLFSRKACGVHAGHLHGETETGLGDDKDNWDGKSQE